MHVASLWLVTYVLPALITGGALQFFSRHHPSRPKCDALIIHAGLAVSILANHYAFHVLGFAFPWYPHLLSILTYAASMFFAMYMLGIFGMWYSLSAFLQQLTILSISFLLLHELPLFLVLLLVVPLFALGHTQNVQQRRMRIAVLSLWGVASITLFTILSDVYLLAALHTLLGTIGIRRSIVYPMK